MRRAHCQWWVTLLGTLILAPIVAAAPLIVIYDTGDTRPIAPFLEILQRSELAATDKASPPTPALGAADLSALLPIRSPTLSPGRVVRREIDQPFARPFFLVGADALSREWLATNRERLLVIGAVGMLVEADTIDDVQAIAEIAGGLPILPASATDIASALGLRHYPVLISRHGIEQ